MTNKNKWNTFKDITLEEVDMNLEKLEPPGCSMCDEHRLLTMDEVLKVTRYTGRATIYRWMREGLRATYTGIGYGGTRFAVSDIKDFLNKNKQERGSKNVITKN